ncbi:SDR family NAD(P)-dependent oxidoreductase [Methylobacterium sp. J-026]|uniref:SDR family NAD(P)-dependent oxidoreductase n=1 Tax=Methylobacterium sp. J-026 TaxID=2836624 RepID=UPI001FB9F53E|nr:SDR family NAD(P)-dependent oxidoreductase [Methylobacterium sp. J-026]MCJ2132482.1 SDR family NAD(P)-dependent oxidoreductase [Methylobacterium sp. J-026]
MDSLAERRFTPDDQRAFAAMSGDHNPMHMDAQAARRLQAGRPVVHGIHAVLWAIEAAAELPTGAEALTVQFDRMIYVGDLCRLRRGRRGAEGTHLEIVVDDVAVTRIGLLPAADRPPPPASSDARTLALETRGAEVAAAFPRAAAALGLATLVDLVGLSKLVGMVCPGLHSIFRGFSVARGAGAAVGAEMRFSVLRDDARFNLVSLRVDGTGLSGQVDAFRRPPPTAQPGIDALRGRVQPEAFAGRRALVVGGSRGLGELTAKLLALGGAAVTITFAVGDGEAGRVAEEIRAAGGRCEVLRLDVRQRPIAGHLPAGRVFDQLYYFATPSIFGKRGRALDAALLDTMTAFYVHAFYETCAALRDAGPHAIDVFYPSSVAVAARPAGLTEYAMAKAAGEVLCADLPRLLKGVRAHVRRLPRLQTDQTASVQPVETGSAIDEMLAAIHSVQPTAPDIGPGTLR